MKTVYYTATSLDGYIATEDDGVDWLFPLGDVNDTGYASFIAEIDQLSSADYGPRNLFAPKVLRGP